MLNSSRTSLVLRITAAWMLVATALASGCQAATATDAEPGLRVKVLVTSSLDGSEQPCYLIVPKGFNPDGEPVALLVSLHSWSAGVEQRHPELERLTSERGWIYLFPHFRGPNEHPDACGSVKAQQDILDAVAWVRQRYPIDSRRIYLTGSSGGGHMTMLMVGCHPDPWAAASAWVGISDLAAWHARHATDRYGAMLRASCGGRPGDSEAVDEQYRLRSPLTHLHRAGRVPLDLAAGVHDGHSGSVPIRHTLEAFNAVASTVGAPPVSNEEIAQLSRTGGRLNQPQSSDQVVDPTFGRAIYLRRHAGPSRVTIFEGGHEGIAAAAIAWLEQHVRDEPEAEQ